jgi:hypothetical protein
MSSVVMGIFLVWRTFRNQLTTFSAPFTGIFFAGGIFSTAIGVAILPMSLYGLLLLIGVLGFTPFVTAFVYFRSGVRAMKDQVNNSTYDFRFMTAALAALFIIAFSVLGSMYLQEVMPRSTRIRNFRSLDD